MRVSSQFEDSFQKQGPQPSTKIDHKQQHKNGGKASPLVLGIAIPETRVSPGQSSIAGK